MTKINIVIIGGAQACRASLDISAFNNYKKWNNPCQADHNDILSIQSILHHKVKVYCIDPLYNFNANDKNIRYINDLFNIGDTQYCTKSGHTIFIEFCNLLDEYYVTKPYYVHPITAYNDYKISWISCGCMWDKGFPISLITNLVENHIYTPTDIKSYHSYIYAHKFNDSDRDQLFQPYCQGLYHVLGSMIWRGSSHDAVLFDLIPKLQITEDTIIQDLSAFLSQEKQWNALNRDTRLKINELIFGNLIKI